MAGILDKIKQAYTKAVQSSTPTVSDIASGNYAGVGTEKATPTATNKAALTVTVPTSVSKKTDGTPTTSAPLTPQQQVEFSLNTRSGQNTAARATAMVAGMQADGVYPGVITADEVGTLEAEEQKPLNDDRITYKAPAQQMSTYDAYAQRIAEQNNIMQQQMAEQQRLLQEQYEAQERQRRANLDATLQANNDQADKSLREAYIANMLARRNLPQQLKMNGISGGATETIYGDILNTYMNNRNNIETNRLNANNQARLAFDNGLAGDYDKFLTNKINLANTRSENASKMALAQANAKATQTASGSSRTGVTTSQDRSNSNNNNNATTPTTTANREIAIAENLITNLRNQGLNQVQINDILKRNGYIA